MNGIPRPALPFDPYPNYETYTVALMLENERVLHDKLIEAAVKADYRLAGAAARAAAGTLSRFKSFPEPDDDGPFNLWAVDWELLAKDWNETAREVQSFQCEAALTGQLGRVVPVLESLTCTPPGPGTPGWLITIPGKLDRDLYANVNKVLEGLGGKWNRKLGGHLYPAGDDPREALENVIETGSFKKPTDITGYFPTPAQLADEVVARASLAAGLRVLEPSIGQGHLADAVKRACPDVRLIGVEFNPKNAALARQRHDVIDGDFLAQTPDPSFDRVVMNPPFAKGQEVTHLLHAYDFLKDDGRLVAVMSGAVEFRGDRRYAGLRTALAIMGGTIDPNPDGAFRSSGTDVRTVTVCLDRIPGLSLQDVCELAGDKLTAESTLADARALVAAQRAARVAQPTRQAAPAIS